MIRGVPDRGIIDCFEVLKYFSTVVSSHTATHVPMIPKWDSIGTAIPRHASVGKPLGERDDKCPMRAKLSQFGGLSAHKHEETFAQIGLSPVNLLVNARCVLSAGRGWSLQWKV